MPALTGLDTSEPPAPTQPAIGARRADLSAPQDMGLDAGVRVGRYELLTKIAEGGMAVVWLARVTGSFGFEKLVALKTIQPEFARDSNYQRMFLDESNIASQVRHPNVVELLDVGIYEGVPFQVLEWIDGDSLTVLQRAANQQRQSLPVPILLKVVAQVCAGLHAAHELRVGGVPRRVVHRDVSPQNVLVSQEGQVKLIDFGIAKAESRLSEETRAGILKGKVSYMAPEQLAGEAVDHRADIWSCGVMLHQLLFGATPNGNIAPGQRNTWIELSERVRTLSPEVEAILLKALAARPQDRFSSAREMEQAIEHALCEWGPITTHDVSRALEPFRVQRQARLIVIEGALDDCRRRDASLGKAESSPPLLRIVPRTSVTRSSLPPPFPTTRVSQEPRLPAHPSAIASVHVRVDDREGENVLSSLRELKLALVKLVRSSRRGLLARALRWSAEARRTYVSLSRRTQSILLFGSGAIVALTMSSLFDSQAEASSKIEVSLKDVPVCRAESAPLALTLEGRSKH